MSTASPESVRVQSNLAGGLHRCTVQRSQTQRNRAVFRGNAGEDRTGGALSMKRSAYPVQWSEAGHTRERFPGAEPSSVLSMKSPSATWGSAWLARASLQFQTRRPDPLYHLKPVVTCFASGVSTGPFRICGRLGCVLPPERALCPVVRMDGAVLDACLPLWSTTE